MNIMSCVCICVYCNDGADLFDSSYIYIPAGLDYMGQ